MDKEEFTKERIKNLDKVIFVSQYHADRPEFVDIPDSKKLVSGNGITPADFDKLDGKSKRDPQRCLYMSANERGLRILYDIWPDVKKAVPRATLDIYYGWDSFDAINRDNPERMAWKAYMVQTAKSLDGVTEHGRIGQTELNKEIFKSGILAYPCTFPEVNCITAQKAMAGGIVPITSDFAVMRDIIKFGEVVPMHDFQEKDIKAYKKTLIKWLNHPEAQNSERPAMMKWARETFDWKNTARQWDKDMR
jgi:glycosyltransferase involved in cell wall biosynthesis